MKQLKQIEWEEEFDNRFPQIKVGEFMGKRLWADEKGKYSIYVESYPNETKKFIQSLLAKQKQEITDEYNAMKEAVNSGGLEQAKLIWKQKLRRKISKLWKLDKIYRNDTEDNVYNQALDDVLKLLEE